VSVPHFCLAPRPGATVDTLTCRLILLGLAATTGSACLSAHRFDASLDSVRALVRHVDCHDGAPARILVDPRCVDGICGVTCAPDRWRPPPP
jgi:hypothetical protein